MRRINSNYVINISINTIKLIIIIYIVYCRLFYQKSIKLYLKLFII